MDKPRDPNDECTYCMKPWVFRSQTTEHRYCTKHYSECVSERELHVWSRADLKKKTLDKNK